VLHLTGMVIVRAKRPEPLSRWMEQVIRLPAGLAAHSGPLKLHPYQHAIADALADPKIERVSVLKSARTGFTTIVVGAIAHLEAIEWPEGHPARVLPRF
jgi:phage terminase large subunit GpA-like protein